MLPKPYNPYLIDPALLTLSEYRDKVDPNHKTHPNTAYDYDLESLNKFEPSPEDFPIYIRRLRIHGLIFEVRMAEEHLRYLKRDTNDEIIRIDGEPVEYTPEEIQRMGKKPVDYSFGVFENGKKVAAVQDEWGCVLVIVAREYRGFGLGPILVKLIRTLDPYKPSGGFSPSGFRNFVRVHREFVRDALRNGYYSSLVKQGSLTVERVKEIVQSSTDIMDKLSRAKDIQNDNTDLNSNDPKTWMLYVGEYGDFVIYDRKLKDVLQNTDRSFFLERMIKGIAYVSIQGNRTEHGKLMVYGGDTPIIRKFLMNCAIEYCRRNNVNLFLEENEPNDVDKSMATVATEKTIEPGFWSFEATPTGKTFNYDGLGQVEKQWRKTFDRYDEFYHSMIEMAYAKFKH